jgi:hypothetical protein
MTTNKLGLIAIILFISVFAACSGGDKQKVLKNEIKGTITVSSEVDTTGDYSGIQLLIRTFDQDGSVVDTLYSAVTDSAGNFSGTAQFDRRSIYILDIRRNNVSLGLMELILSDYDPVIINAELPDIISTQSVSSVENKAFELFQRANRGFNRINSFINAGVIAQDSIGIELENWSNLFWDLYNEHYGTLASELALGMSLSIIDTYADDLMLERIRISTERDDSNIILSANLGMNYYAYEQGLDAALAFLDTLQGRAQSEEKQQQLKMNRIKILSDSSRVQAATSQIALFKSEYRNDEAAVNWANDMLYDLEKFGPGSPMPDFFFTADGTEFSKTGMEGTPYIIEFTRLDNPLYQLQFERNIAIYQIYRNFGLQFITIPLHQSELTVNTFFEERAKMWRVADVSSVDIENVEETFNINVIPTRFLVDKNGNIIRKFEGTAYDDIVRSLRLVLNGANTRS